jgi:succinylarginine dihydrolase
MAVDDPEESVALPDDIASTPIVSGSRVVSIDQLVERWWRDHFPGSPVARDTQAWNVAYTAKETLKRLLKRSI